MGLFLFPIKKPITQETKKRKNKQNSLQTNSARRIIQRPSSRTNWKKIAVRTSPPSSRSAEKNGVMAPPQPPRPPSPPLSPLLSGKLCGTTAQKQFYAADVSRGRSQVNVMYYTTLLSSFLFSLYIFFFFVSRYPCSCLKFSTMQLLHFSFHSR